MAMTIEKLPEEPNPPRMTQRAPKERAIDVNTSISPRSEKVFDTERPPFKRVIEKIRNAQVGDDVAWVEFQAVIPEIAELSAVRRYINDPKMYQFGARQLFDAAREAFILIQLEQKRNDPRPEVIQQQYRNKKRNILSPLSEFEFQNIRDIANVYEMGLFPGIVTLAK